MGATYGDLAKKRAERPKIAMRWTIHMLSLVRESCSMSDKDRLLLGHCYLLLTFLPTTSGILPKPIKINHKKRMKKEFISRHTGFEILEVFLEPFMICILTVQIFLQFNNLQSFESQEYTKTFKESARAQSPQGMCRSQNVQYHCIVTFSKMADDHKEVLSGCWGLESNKNGT